MYIEGRIGGRGEIVKKLRRQNEGICKCLRTSTGGREGLKKLEILST